MLSRSSIFLKLMGSFYEQIGSTAFNKSFDLAYSSILLNRYSDIINRITNSSRSGTILNSVKFGYIKISEVDIVSGEIKVYDINNVEIFDYDTISASFIDADTFYLVSKTGSSSIVEEDFIAVLSEYTGYNVIPVVVATTGYINVSFSDWISINGEAADLLIRETSAHAIDMLSRNVLYKKKSVAIIDKISNIILGAMYAMENETVVRIDSSTVYTDKNEYLVDVINAGKIIVAEGDVLSPMDLISRISFVHGNVNTIGEVSDIQRYMVANGLSPSNMRYLGKLSSAISKRRLMVEIPLDVMNLAGVDALSAIHETIGVSPGFIVSSGSYSVDESVINVSARGGMMISNVDTGEIASIGRWILAIDNASTINIFAEEKLIINMDYDNNNQQTVFFDSYLPLYGKIAVSEEAEYMIEAINIIEDTMDADPNDEELMFGDLTDTVLSDISDNSNLLIPDLSVISTIDTNPDGKEHAIFYGGDTVEIVTSEVKDISIKKLVNATITDTIKQSVIDIFDMSFIDSGYFETTIFHNDIVDFDFLNRSVLSEHYNNSVTLDEGMVAYDNGIASVESVPGGFVNIDVSSNFLGEETTKVKKIISEIIIMSDDGAIESDNVIDE